MKAAVIVFPGSNCDRDVAVSIEKSFGARPIMHWHRDTDLPDVDLIAVPGGFSYGDYLRSGAMAAHSPVMREVKARADKGVLVLGICNGFQILSEAGLVPGVLMRNANLKFVCRDVTLSVERADTPFTSKYAAGQTITVPVAHHDGNFFATPDELKRIEGQGQVAFRYAEGTNPNGSTADIAGVLNEKGNVLGMMPHPERLADPLLGGTDGKPMFDALADALAG